MKKAIISFLFLLLPLLILYPGFNNFILPAGSSYSDLTISHYPNLIYLKHSLAEWGEIPLWSNTILSGYPFFANPLSGLWYPFTWLLVILPLPFGYNLLFILHLLVGAFGIYYCLRMLGMNEISALFGGITFELMPKIMAHYAAGHITLVFAVCITPWLIYVELKRRKSSFRLWDVSPGILLGLISLADLRWTPFAFLLWCAFSVYRHILENADLFQIKNLLTKKNVIQLGKFFIFLFSQFIIAVSIAAPVLLPMLQYSSLATRSGLTLSDRLFLSLPPLRLIGVIFPDFWGYCELVTYPGILSVCAVIFVVTHKKTREQNVFWLLVILVSFLYALGSYNPLMPVITSIPGFNSLRVPPRILFTAGIAFSMITGAFIHYLTEKKRFPAISKLSIIALCVFSIMFLGGVFLQSKVINFEFLWGTLFLMGFTIVILFFLRHQKFHFFFIGILLILLVLDLGTINFAGFNMKSIRSQLENDSEVVSFLSDDEEIYRVYSPSYSIPQQVGALSNLELADGIDPIQLISYVDYMEAATGVPNRGYSVTLPAYQNGKPQSDNKIYKPDPHLLGLLNVKYVVAEFDLDVKGLDLVKQINQKRIYQNSLARPRAWIQAGYELGSPMITESEIVLHSPNLISIETNGPGILVLSEIVYPGWIAKVNGSPSSIISIGGIFRGIELNAGHHLVEFDFRPQVMLVGIAVMLFAIIFLVIWLVFIPKITRDSNHENN